MEKCEGRKVVPNPYTIIGQGSTFPWRLNLRDYTSDMGLIAILRGVKPDEVVEVGEAI
eukprot:SAG31_NODE_26379_length_443_cov_1.052326_1_plen_57_part_01